MQHKGATSVHAWPFLVTLYDCAVGHPDCSHCQAANGSLGCLWCADGQPACRYGPLCPPGSVELLCPMPSIDKVSHSQARPLLPILLHDPVSRFFPIPPSLRSD